MYYIVDTESRAILTYQDGTKIIYSRFERASSHAYIAQQAINHQYTVIPITHPEVDSLHRIVAPWISKR